MAGDLPARVLVRLTALLYEAMLLVALLAAATALFIAVAGDSRQPPMRYVLQFGLVVVAGAYFVWFWSADRQTLPMRTWRLHLTDLAGRPLDPMRAALRFVFAAVGCLAGGTTFLWAFVDPQRQFLHDRLARTRLVRRLPAP